MTAANVALMVGVLVVAGALWIQVSKKEITILGVALTLVGFIFMTSQTWGSIVFDPSAGKVELKQFADATQAAGDVAGQVEVLAGEVSGIKTQLIDLASMLRAGQTVSPDAARQIESRLSRIPTVDSTKLRSARATLGRVRTDISRIPPE